jgi:NAD-reducing hydrogenase large subunit
MGERILIDPVTRIEGHAKITISLDDAGAVADARFHVAEFRGFEKFCEGRPFYEMAGITARVCGICPVSHLIASVKAGDAILAVAIPPAAEKLRRLLNLGQITQSHALSFFYLSAPDLLLGFDSPPESRNVFGLAAADPELARAGIRLRQFGQEIIEALGGQKIHPAWVAPGGVRAPLSEERRQHIRGRLPEARATATRALDLFKSLLDKYQEEADTFGNFPSLFLGMAADDGTWEHYGGRLRFVDSQGRIVADGIEAARYQDYIGEAAEPWSWEVPEPVAGSPVEVRLWVEQLTGLEMDDQGTVRELSAAQVTERRRRLEEQGALVTLGPSTRPGPPGPAGGQAAPTSRSRPGPFTEPTFVHGTTCRHLSARGRRGKRRPRSSR